MRFKIVRLNLLVGIQLLEPYLLLPTKLAEVFDTFYKALSPRHRISLTDMQSIGGNSFGDLKLTINVFSGNGRIDITPTGLITDLRNLVQTDEDLKVIRDYLVTCEHSLITALRKDEKPLGEILQRDVRANVWIECEKGRDAAEAWLIERGSAALTIANDAFGGLKREYTLQIHLVDEKGTRRLGVGIQKSLLADVGHLFLACEHQLHRKDEALGPMDAHFDRAYAELEDLLRQLGLEPARDNA